MGNKFKHAEAFCLMTYKCDKCKKEEIIWNSRDGVTPFTIACNVCDGYMEHINWRNDKVVINHKPKKEKEYS